MKFFIDNNLGERLAKGLQCFGEDVIHLKDCFLDNTPDTEWLQYIGNECIFLITRDLHIRWRPAEKQAFIENEVGAFFLAGKNRTRCDLIQQLVRNWPRIKEYAFANRHKRPFMFRVPPTGKKIERIPIN